MLFYIIKAYLKSSKYLVIFLLTISFCILHHPSEFNFILPEVAGSVGSVLSIIIIILMKI